jgi:hypothetical protein
VSPPAPDLSERYGTGSRTRWTVVAVSAVLVLAAAVWLVWALSAQGRPAVSSQLVGFHVRGEHAVSVSFTVVRRDADVHATCLLRALAGDHGIVGEVTVPVEHGPAVSRVRSTVRTERAATSVDLVGCTTDHQHSRR